MKGKKSSAFSNTSTGYGKANKSSHNHHHSKSNQYNNKSGKTESKTEKLEKISNECSEQHDEDLNSGFGDYLRSPEAVEMMKLFIFANSVMLILTMAWPNIKENYYMFMHWWGQEQ